MKSENWYIKINECDLISDWPFTQTFQLLLCPPTDFGPGNKYLGFWPKKGFPYYALLSCYIILNYTLVQ